MNRTDSLALFVKAVDTGSLSGAARALGLSLPSASRHITALEERIGTRLVIRTTRSLALTEAGRIYYEHAKQILAHLDEVEANLLADAAVPSGRRNSMYRYSMLRCMPLCCSHSLAMSATSSEP